ncbi:TerC family protein [Adlercreutzia sp. ZJ138]|uniref:TerC family protein n=1 Tax=Adlercreutzia sp. ZJ138 TaxID=2709405 RepID=UPI0013EBADA4|nr:TerC family protein [Adlercreutzia sp. ZJ138]
MDFSIFLTPEAWISLVTLMFLEIVLGVDNLVFISITSDRLPEEKQHIGRKLGLAGALASRVIFLCFASYLVHMTNPLFTIDLGAFSHGFSVRDIVLFAGGAYLIYKGIIEMREVLALTELKAESSGGEHATRRIGLPQAVGTIMVMDIVFSIDSVITAVGLANHLIIMILAVMIAVILMMIFIDPISNFINKHAEMKILALCFIVVIGVLLVLDGMGINSGIEVLDMHAEKLMVYFAMVFAFVLELIQMRYNSALHAWRKQRWASDTDRQLDAVRAELEQRLAEEREVLREDGESNRARKEGAPERERVQPVIIGNNVYVMMPVAGEDAASFKQLMAASDGARAALDDPLEIEVEGEIVEEN